jgi:putative acetyltransferase
MHCTLRSAVSADSEAVRRIVGSVLAEYGMTVDLGDRDSDLADVEASYLRAGGVFYVLVDATGAVVGGAGLMPIRAGVGELRKMYLLPSARGHGHGRRLLRLLLDDARRLGFHRVELETASVLKEAISLYEAHGFRPMPLAHPGRECARSCPLAYALDLA